MTGEELERAIELLRQSQAKNSTDIALTREAVNKLVETVAQDRREDREQFAPYGRGRLNREQFEETRAQSEAHWQETREALNNLIVANDATRALAEKVAALATTTGQRVTALEIATKD